MYNFGLRIEWCKFQMTFPHKIHRKIDINFLRFLAFSPNFQANFVNINCLNDGS